MSFNLSNFFHYRNVNSANTAAGAGRNPSAASARVSGNNSLTDVQPGSSFTGKVVETKDGMVTIQLADSTLVSANLKGNILLEAGSQVTFVVNSNQNQIVLSPLFTNTAISHNIENALKAAELPITEQTVNMVSDMMEQGMSVDKESLLSMYRQITNHPDIDGSAVVKLTQMGLAINELNAASLEQYENLNHQLSGSITELSEGLQQAIASIEGENTETLMQLFDGIMDSIAPLQEGDAQALLSILSGNSGEHAAALQAENGTLVSEVLTEVEMQQLSDLVGLAGGEEALVNAMAKGELSPKEALQLINQLAQGQGGGGQGEAAAAATTTAADNPANQVIFTEEQLLNGQTIGNGLPLKELLGNEAVGKLLQHTMEKNWLMEPKDVANKEKVEEFYEQLKNQTGKVAETASDVLGKDAPLTQSANQLSQNIDFLNQLNHTFTYVQLPLRLNGQNANGDLYVYTNKKNLADKDGKVSAFLHLDMDNLGCVDVYVAMEQQRVSTNFMVADDSILDLIEQNIDLLNERLEKRGYQLTSKVSLIQEETSVLQEMQKELGQSALPLAMYSFDVRA